MRRGSTRWPQLEEHVAEWVSKLRQGGYIATRIKIRAYVLRWAKANEIKNFKATLGCCSRFMNKKNLVIQQKKKITQNLPRNLNHNVANFHPFIIGLRNKICIPYIVSESWIRPN